MSVVVGMAGLSHPHSAMHLRTLEASGEVHGIALWDPDPTARERAAGNCRKTDRAYANLDDLLDRADVPIVFVALPNAETAEVVERAARLGST